MKKERISIGIFNKETANEIREQIKERNLVRGQKVVSVFRGRGGRKEDRQNFCRDIPIKKADKVSVYLDVVTKDDEFVLPYLVREAITFRLAEKMMAENETETKRKLVYGTEGLMKYSDLHLIKTMLSYF